jgi:hypothetical protein
MKMLGFGRAFLFVFVGGKSLQSKSLAWRE